MIKISATKNRITEIGKAFKYGSIVICRNYRNFKDGIMGTFSPTGLLLFLIIIGLIGLLGFKLVKKLKNKELAKRTYYCNVIGPCC